jgi:poly(3-hydroxybutyrate) depolymerase
VAGKDKPSSAPDKALPPPLRDNPSVHWHPVTRAAALAALVAACADPASEGGSDPDGDTAAVDDTTAGESGSDDAKPTTTTSSSGGGSSGAPATTTNETSAGETAATDDSGPGALLCPGLPGDPGLTNHSMAVGSTMRDYLLYIPETLDPERGVPLVFVHHGASMSGDAMHSVTGFADVADEDGFVVAFPEGTSSLAPWNVGPSVCAPGNLANGNGDDFAFLDGMIDAIAASHCIDRERVFVTGFSMGGYFSNHVGCAHSDRVRAVAAHSGGTYTGSCDRSPMPVLIVHGSADGLINLECGTQARDEWVARNGCSSEFDIVPVAGGGCQEHRDCPAGGQVTLCVFNGMAHGWAGGSGIYGGGTSYEDATRLVWDFFAEQ